MDKESRSQINSQMSPMQILQMGFNPQQLQVLMHQYQQQQQQQLAFQTVSAQCKKIAKMSHLNFHVNKRILFRNGLILTLKMIFMRK